MMHAWCMMQDCTLPLVANTLLCRLWTMSSGCFSWCPLLIPWKLKFKITGKKSEVSINSGCTNYWTTNCVQKRPENELAIVSPTQEYTSVDDRVMETYFKAVRGLIHTLPTLTHILIQNLSGNSREVIPTTKYITATGKQALILLQSAAALIPVPLIQEAIGVALKIIKACEVLKIPPKKVCEIIHKILLSGYICRRAKGPKAAR